MFRPIWSKLWISCRVKTHTTNNSSWQKLNTRTNVTGTIQVNPHLQPDLTLSNCIQQFLRSYNKFLSTYDIFLLNSGQGIQTSVSPTENLTLLLVPSTHSHMPWRLRCSISLCVFMLFTSKACPTGCLGADTKYTTRPWMLAVGRRSVGGNRKPTGAPRWAASWIQYITAKPFETGRTVKHWHYIQVQSKCQDSPENDTVQGTWWGAWKQ